MPCSDCFWIQSLPESKLNGTYPKYCSSFNIYIKLLDFLAYHKLMYLMQFLVFGLQFPCRFSCSITCAHLWTCRFAGHQRWWAQLYADLCEVSEEWGKCYIIWSCSKVSTYFMYKSWVCRLLRQKLFIRFTLLTSNWNLPKIKKITNPKIWSEETKKDILCNNIHQFQLQQDNKKHNSLNNQKYIYICITFLRH